MMHLACEKQQLDQLRLIVLGSPAQDRESTCPLPQNQHKTVAFCCFTLSSTAVPGSSVLSDLLQDLQNAKKKEDL